MVSNPTFKPEEDKDGGEAGEVPKDLGDEENAGVEEKADLNSP